MVLQVLSKDREHVYAIFLTRPTSRMEATEHPTVTFHEAPAGTVPPIRAWFYAGEKFGLEFAYTRVQGDYAEIAREFFSAAEVEHLTALPSHLYAKAFLSCWTRKEAYLKARGEGLMAANDIVPAQGWSFYTLEPAPGYIGALAIEGSGWRLTQRQ